jgi:hypothetical protein
MDLNNLVGIYRATVEDNKDEENRGRVRVRIHGIHSTSVQTSELPFVEPFSPIGGNPSINFFYVPPVGTTCYISFINGQVQNPVITGFWRHSLKPILEDASYFHGKKDEALFFIKLGGRETAPVLKFDSVKEKILMMTKTSVNEFGSSTVIQSEKGNSFVNMKSWFSNIGTRISQSGVFKKGGVLKGGKDIAVNLINMTKAGVKEWITGEKTVRISNKRKTIIGRGKEDENDALMETFSQGSTVEEAVKEGKLGEISLFSGPGGLDLKTKITNMIKSKSFNPKKTLLQNLFDYTKKGTINLLKSSKKILKDGNNRWKSINSPKKLAGQFRKITSGIAEKNRTILGRIFKERINERQAETLINSDKLNSKKIKNMKDTGVENNKTVMDELTIYGGQEQTITGEQSISITKNKTEIIKGRWTFQSSGRSVMKFPNGGLTMTFMRNDFKIQMPPLKNTIISGGSKPDNVVKKQAYNDLFDLVLTLFSYMNVHMHNATAPGAPTSPPILPTPYASWQASPAKLAKVVAGKLIPVPTNLYFTNNLKSS